MESKVTIEPFELYDRSDSLSIRWIIYTHLAGVVWTASLSLADRGLFISLAFSDWYSSFFEWNPLASLIILGIMFGCPLLMFVNLFKPSLSLSWGQRTMAAFAEILLFFANLFALLPAVQ